MNNYLKHAILSATFTISLICFITACGPSNPDNARTPSDTEASETNQEASDTAENEQSTKESDTTPDSPTASSKPKLVYYQMPG